MAPSTPPPPNNVVLAAFTIALTRWVVMSPWTASIASMRRSSRAAACATRSTSFRPRSLSGRAASSCSGRASPCWTRNSSIRCLRRGSHAILRLRQPREVAEARPPQVVYLAFGVEGEGDEIPSLLRVTPFRFESIEVPVTQVPGVGWTEAHHQGALLERHRDGTVHLVLVGAGVRGEVEGGLGAGDPRVLLFRLVGAVARHLVVAYPEQL